MPNDANDIANYETEERRYVLQDGKLTWFDPSGKEGNLAYGDVVGVTLRKITGTEFNNYHRLVISGRDGHELQLTNIIRTGAIKFEHRNEAFRGFVFTLHRKLSAVSPAISFTTGMTRRVYQAYSAGYVLFCLFLVTAAVASWINGRTGASFGSMGLMLLSMPLAFWQFRRIKPTNYDPNNIPLAILPHN